MYVRQLLNHNQTINAMKIYLTIIISTLFFFRVYPQKSISKVQYLPSLQNVNHPQIAYWFFNKDMMDENVWKKKIDSLVANSNYTMVFLSSRNGLDFFNPQLMKPTFSNLVKYAHEKGLKVGLQLWGTNKGTSEQSCERVIVENEVILDQNGRANLSNTAKHVRNQSGKPFKATLLKAYMFKKTTSGFYQTGTLADITDLCKITAVNENTISLQIENNSKFSGYNVYVMTQHFYPVSSNHSAEAVNKFVDVMQAYKEIPFDGIGLDEYTNLKLYATWELQKENAKLRERLYSINMAKSYKKRYGSDLERTLFDMRYAPQNQPEIRIKAVNTYMDLMRKGSLNVETAVYDSAKKIYGDKTFVGLHNSHHNHLDGDEVWQTGINWWNVKRDYGHTDERTPLPTQMGIAYGYKMNMLYNMFYDKSLEAIQKKAYSDIKYNIRTHYHAINDVQNWGVSVEERAALNKINPVEHAARLMNYFNAPLPEVKLLVVFGREALMNWYPDSTNRGICDINDKLKIEDKALKIWNAGFKNALVPTDVIIDNRLVVNQNGKAVYNGHVFDAIVFLYPEYAQEKTLSFLEQYLSKGGKLMVEGSATKDFFGKDISARWKKLIAKKVISGLDIAQLTALGISKDNTADRVKMIDGSYLFSNYDNFSKNLVSYFAQKIDGDSIEGSYLGYAAVKLLNHRIEKFAATGFQELKLNGKLIFRLSKPADVVINLVNNQYQIKVAGEDVKVMVNEL